MKEVNIAIFTGIEDMKEGFYQRQLYSLIKESCPDIKAIIFPNFMVNFRKDEITLKAISSHVDYILINPVLVGHNKFIKPSSHLVEDSFRRLPDNTLVSFATVLVEKLNVL